MIFRKGEVFYASIPWICFICQYCSVSLLVGPRSVLLVVQWTYLR